ncbi:CDP-diacylglycerol--serine O-phosphatidyltransferase [Alphaproteobacteria bacterium]|nr:CDP-diacylglycerol--serine O-phosphatidyltransferase [Alphaproteobacteria bacterium]
MKFPPGPTHRIRVLPFNKLAPNILTLLALCAGLTSLRFGLHGQWQPAVISVFLAGVFDGLDGRVARLLQGTSKFGAELDSLSDFVCFGVAPAMLLYFWTLQEAGAPGWASVLLFSVCCALRLARFNTALDEPDKPPFAHNYFTGVPAPAAAGLALAPMILSFQTGGADSVFHEPAVPIIVLIGVSFLMVSRIPTYSGKRFRVPSSYVLPMMLAVGLFAAFLVSEPWLTIATLLLLYGVSIPFAARSYFRSKAAMGAPKAPVSEDSR